MKKESVTKEYLNKISEMHRLLVKGNGGWSFDLFEKYGVPSPSLFASSYHSKQDNRYLEDL